MRRQSIITLPAWLSQLVAAFASECCLCGLIYAASSAQAHHGTTTGAARSMDPKASRCSEPRYIESEFFFWSGDFSVYDDVEIGVVELEGA